MKPEKFAAFPVGFLMACLLSIGAMGSMITGLDLPVEDMESLYRAWTLCALAGCILFLFQKGWMAALIFTVAGLVWLGPEYTFTLPARALISRLSYIYNSAYGWGLLEFAGVEWQKVLLDLPLMVWGCLIALSAAGTVMQGRGLTLTVVLSLLPAAATIVVTNTVPDAPFLYILMLGMILLLLPATVRRHCPGQGAKLTVMTALPVAALLALLFHSYPQDTYVNRSEEYLNRVVSWWQSTASFSMDNTGLISQTPVGPNASATTNLSRVGPRNIWDYTVMEAEADFSDTIYLRGQDFDVYDGTSWTATADRMEPFGAENLSYKGTLTIRTPNTANVQYEPYYSNESHNLFGGRIPNEERAREYTYQVGSLLHTGFDVVTFDGADVVTDLDIADSDSYRSDGIDTDYYTDLPDGTRRWAEDYVAQIAEDNGLNSGVPLTTSAAVKFISDHVRSSALYDTNTPRMSREYADFVQWFLTESDTGYCVHFASATAVLLRAAGIPARYVTGYMFDTVKDATVEVTADQAHAWVEYYDGSRGAWIALESTPADLREEETAPSETEPERTEPEETEPAAASPTEDQEDQTRPGAPRPGQQEGPKIDLTWLWTALKWLLAPAVLWIAVLVQYIIRRNLRRKGRGPNARALALWQDVEGLCRITNQEPPGELEHLAQKAKFSQHTLTAEELKAFTAWLREERDTMKKKPWYIRFLCRYVLALW